MKLCVCFNEERTELLLNTLLKSGEAMAINTLQQLVVMRPTSPERMQQMQDKFAQSAPHLKFFSMDQIREAGRKNLLPFKCPGPAGTYVINFTSGTTGIPKGVIITCGAFKHVICSVLSSANILDVS
ncbi:hypothetical protein Ciccas_008614 [Cichlidogyrus casuarinus]|uniref:AMP-dependent synthetase/ligase domain-containing protein n=1 Tax=Cichlidogyrus casuarinus TaxID=1844966 RepID=A0ABD2Q0A4_9PLAT